MGGNCWLVLVVFTIEPFCPPEWSLRNEGSHFIVFVKGNEMLRMAQHEGGLLIQQCKELC